MAPVPPRRGLADIEPSAGEVVAYAAKEGTFAQDGPENANSPYATALVKSLKEPGLEIRLLFGKVRDDVSRRPPTSRSPILMPLWVEKPFTSRHLLRRLAAVLLKSGNWSQAV